MNLWLGFTHSTVVWILDSDYLSFLNQRTQFKASHLKAQACALADEDRTAIQGCHACLKHAEHNLVEFREQLGRRIGASNNGLVCVSQLGAPVIVQRIEQAFTLRKKREGAKTGREN
ncbi:hypothetical protein B0H13DRAFT_1895424 [Mycena leptocephala]|nr:hypothetical protein B0H13DRAFT_1895424 [Mycena leptocephala]